MQEASFCGRTVLEEVGREDEEEGRRRGMRGRQLEDWQLATAELFSSALTEPLLCAGGKLSF